MKKLFRLLAVAAALATTTVAMAQTSELLNFSYTWHSGDTVTGSFRGMVLGNLVTDITNIYANYDGAAFVGSGSLATMSIRMDSGGTYWQSGHAVASFDGTANNFNFVDYDWVAGPANIANMFYSIPTDAPYASFRRTMTAYDRGLPGLVNSSWCLSTDACATGNVRLAPLAVAVIPPAPEPETYALLLAGLAAITFISRRRKPAQR